MQASEPGTPKDPPKKPPAVMRFLCCFSSPDLTEPLPVARHDREPHRPHHTANGTTSSTYIVPENVKNASSPLDHHDSPLSNDPSHSEIPAPDRSRHKSSMSSPPDPHESDEELRTTGKSAAQWKDEEKATKHASSSQPVGTSSGGNGEDWRRWKDNPANKDYVVLNTLGRGAFADVRLSSALLCMRRPQDGRVLKTCAHALVQTVHCCNARSCGAFL